MSDKTTVLAQISAKGLEQAMDALRKTPHIIPNVYANVEIDGKTFVIELSLLAYTQIK